MMKRKDHDIYKQSWVQLESGIIDLNKTISKLYQFKQMNEINADKLKELYDDGVINKDGKSL